MNTLALTAVLLAIAASPGGGAGPGGGGGGAPYEALDAREYFRDRVILGLGVDQVPLLPGQIHDVRCDGREPESRAVYEAELTVLDLGDGTAVAVPERFGQKQDRGEG